MQVIWGCAWVKAALPRAKEGRPENIRAMWRCLRPPRPSMSLKYGYASSRFGEFLLISEQSCDDPEIVAEHGPRDGEVAVLKSTAAQSAALSLLDDGNAALG